MHTAPESGEKSAGWLKAAAVDIVRTLQQAGCQAFFVGGCVRDELLGRVPKDYDIATGATPDQVQALFPRTLEVGKAFGVVAVVVDHHPFEVATFRTDRKYSDGRRPVGVIFSTPEEDARRRDFTINGMFLDPLTGRLTDYVGGRQDLERRVIRAIGQAPERFREDRLRLLRAVRFAATLDFALDPETAEAIRQEAEHITEVSTERIEQELTRTLMEAVRPGDALRQWAELGLLRPLLPEVTAMIGQEQPPEYHPEGDVFEHTILMLNDMPERSRVMAWSVLLHDVGKPATVRMGVGADGKPRLRFDNHDAVGARMAGEMLEHLRLPRKEIEAIQQIIANHMRFRDVQHMRPARLRRMVGAATFPLELELHRLDCAASHRMLENYEFLKSFQKELASEPVLPPAWVNGRDLLALGIPAGPVFGRWLRSAYDAQLENRFGSREALLEWLRQQVDAGQPPTTR